MVYVIDQVTANSYGLFELDEYGKRHLIILAPTAKICEQVKKDFIKSDLEEAKKKLREKEGKKKQ